MSCREWIAGLVDRARAGDAPGADLERHLAACAACKQRWESELELSAAMTKLRAGAARERSRAESRNELLREFAARQRTRRAQVVKWALVAAMLVMAVLLGELWRSAVVSHSPGDSEQAMNDAAMEALGIQAGSGFVAVPYAPPLAEGEFVRVVRTQLQPAALARMGILVEGGYGDAVTADLVVGQDDLPRAVRLPEEVEVTF